mmetsp:Transcript_18068/g.53913  ORF Transcript_18068/g.53913 Transcript_18068/m.53913 type:complete len:255 (+) Transcript_18068:1252-2016(+)
MIGIVVQAYAHRNHVDEHNGDDHVAQPALHQALAAQRHRPGVLRGAIRDIVQQLVHGLGAQRPQRPSDHRLLVVGGALVQIADEEDVEEGVERDAPAVRREGRGPPGRRRGRARRRVPDILFLGRRVDLQEKQPDLGRVLLVHATSCEQRLGEHFLRHRAGVRLQAQQGAHAALSLHALLFVAARVVDPQVGGRPRLQSWYLTVRNAGQPVVEHSVVEQHASLSPRGQPGGRLLREGRHRGRRRVHRRGARLDA